MDTDSSVNSIKLPNVILNAESTYILGLPIVIALTFDNSNNETHFVRFPKLDLLTDLIPLTIQLEALNKGKSVAIPPSFEMLDLKSFVLNPSEIRRMLYDLSNSGINIKQGKYMLTLTLHIGQYIKQSNSVEIEFVKPGSEEIDEITRLRQLGESLTDTGAWAPFIDKNWNTVHILQKLSSSAFDQLALHLFLHRAIYSPDKISELDIKKLKTISNPILRLEAMLFEYEIHVAKNNIEECQRLALDIMDKRLGLSFRVDQIKQGKGILTYARKSFGVEAKFVKSPESFPYK